jgi:acyl-ACP thioesterase
MQESARSHADLLGWGVESLRQQNRFWVLTRMTIVLDESPAPGSQITVETWPKGAERFFAYRDFLVKNEQGEVFVKATSSWALLGLPERRPTTLEGLEDVMKEREGFHALKDPAPKLSAVSSLSTEFNHRVAYSELDLNGHVNNTRYLTWMLDTLPIAYHRMYRPKLVQMNFLGEVFAEKVVRIRREETAHNSWLFSVADEENKELFRGLMSFQPRK